VRWEHGARHRFLDRIAAESARLGRLVGDLLDTSAIETGELRLRRDWCDVSLLIHAATTCVAGLEPDLVVDVPPNMPAVWADHDRLEQILVNVLDNAVRHGAPPFHIEAAMDGSGSLLTVVVSDHGVGFAPGSEHRSFDAHARGATSPGAGLGLTIARGLAAAHGGTLIVGDSPQRTSVVLTLPVEPEGAADATLEEPDSVASAR
jgi:signal transduction histidine kinase